MGVLKIRDLTEQDLARLADEAERFGLSPEAYARMKRAVGTRRGETARTIRARQPRIAARSSVELIREDRDAR